MSNREEMSNRDEGGGLGARELQTLLLLGQAMNAERDPARICEWVCGGAESLLEARLAAMVLAPAEQYSRESVCGKIGDSSLSEPLARDIAKLAQSDWPASPKSSRVAVLQQSDLPADLTDRGIVHLVRLDVRTIHQDFGTLMVGTDGSQDIGSREQFVLSTLANEAAVALENVRLRREIQSAKEVAESATRRLQVANAELARASTAKDEFLSSMSHELRTPLNAVLSLSESLLEGIYGEVNERQVKTVGIIESSGRHLLSLINDILDLSKVAAGKMGLSIGTVDVEAVCKTSMLFARERAVKKGVKLTTSIDPQVRTVQADERRLKQMLVNLLTNAVKFTDEGTVRLDVRSDTGNGELQFVVSDTGIGIASDDLEKLFAPFTQLESGLDRQYEGTGLGLSLVTRMAELHGGRVTAESEGRGHGSRFMVALPWTLEEQPEAVAEIGGATREELTPAVRKVIIVEDDPTVSKQLRRYMEELDAEVLALPHGTGVITQAETFEPDVILLDIILPPESGWEVLEQLKSNEQTREIPVVIVSILDEPQRALKSGAGAFVVKPAGRDRLYVAIAEALAAGHPASAVARGTPQILLAEDNEMNIVSITDYLEAKGFDVRVARDGVEALEALRAERPDLVLMDMQMPRMDGIEAMQRIRADAALGDLPIIALTALAMTGDKERILEAGADEYASKPVNMKQLVATMEALLGR